MYLLITYFANNFLEENLAPLILVENSYYFYPFDCVFLLKILNYTKKCYNSLSKKYYYKI